METLIGPFVLGTFISQSDTQTVLEGTHLPTGKQVILKASSCEDILGNELKALRTIPFHENVVPLVDLFETQNGKFLVTQKVGNINLFEYLNRFGPIPECDARPMFIELCQAVEHCHSHGVVHGDLKPENIVINIKNSPVICDFGGSLFINRNETVLRPLVVSIPYAPPEVKKKEIINGQALDIWSLGVILFTMITGRVPWTRKQWEEGRFEDLDGENLSETLIVLLKQIFRARPSKRIQLKNILVHPWVLNQPLSFRRGFSLPSIFNKPKEKVNRIRISPSLKMSSYLG